MHHHKTFNLFQSVFFIKIHVFCMTQGTSLWYIYLSSKTDINLFQFNNNVFLLDNHLIPTPQSFTTVCCLRFSLTSLKNKKPQGPSANYISIFLTIFDPPPSPTGASMSILIHLSIYYKSNFKFLPPLMLSFDISPAKHME